MRRIKLVDSMKTAVGFPLVLGVFLLAQNAFCGDGKGESSSTNSGWTRFRGDSAQGVQADCRVPIPWSENQLTRVALPGMGSGTPVVWGNVAYLMSAEADTGARIVIAVDLEQGKIKWQHRYPCAKHRLHQFNTYASSTPCVDGDRVYFAWGDPEHVYVKAFTHGGEEVWTRDFGRYVSQHGFGTSPMLVDGKLVLLDSQDAEELEPGVEPGEDRMLLLSAKTGETIWEKPLPTRRVCYGLPSVREVDGRKELVCATTGQGIFGLDLETGKLNWSHDCFKQRVCASMLLVDGLAVASHGAGGGRDNLLVAYDLETKKERFRINRAAPYVPTPVAHAGLMYLWSDAGIVTCVRTADGSVCWSERIGGNFFSSPVILGDRVVNMSDTGDIIVLAASEGYRKLATVKTEKTLRSTMVAFKELLLIRTEEELWLVRP